MGNNYMLISSVILIISFIPFALIFEKRKPRAREIVLIAVMSSLTVVANIVCAYTIPFHAGTAMVIITGVALGPQAGFLVGAMSRFVCNFFMGQGSWTPWEMAAWGILGAIAGVMFNKVSLKGMLEDEQAIKRQDRESGFAAVMPVMVSIVVMELLGYVEYIIFANPQETFAGWRLYAFGMLGIVAALLVQRKKLPVSHVTLPVFTFAVVFVVYGGLMNIAALVMSNAIGTDSGLNMESLKLLYITGAPYDVMHAAGAAICAYVMGDGIIQKLERIKIKYGILRK